MTGRPWALIAAAAVVLVTVGLVMVFGVARPPDLAHVTDAPAVTPPGRLAWTGYDRNETCLYVLDVDGRVRELRCGDQPAGEVVGWQDGRIVLQVYPSTFRDQEAELLLIDPDTGTVTDTQHEERGRDLPSARLRSERVDGDLVVHVDDEVVWRTPAPEVYRVRRAMVSADGQHVLLQDAADRVLLVPRDGSAPPRVWADDVPSWTSLTWEAAAAR